MSENVSPILAPDREAIESHLNFLFGRALSGRIEVTSIYTDKEARQSPKTRFFEVGDYDPIIDYASTSNAAPGWNTYVGAALRNEDVFPGKAAEDSDFSRTYALWADVDDGDHLVTARAKYRELNVTPPLIVVTGRTPSKRAQFWWPLDVALADISALRAALRGIAAVLGSDPKVCTGKQLMRLAGTVNWPKKDDRILERTELVRIMRAAPEFTVEQLARAFPPLERAEMDAAGISDVVVVQGGALGLETTVMDGRETYAFKLVRANLREFIGTTGAAPTADELYQAVAPIYLKKADQVRAGRGPSFLKQKCVEAVRAFEAGQIPGARTLDEAAISWAEKHPLPAEERDDVDDGVDSVEVIDVFESLSIAEIKALPDAEWTVDDILPKQGLGFIYGAPGSYKTFICYDLALSLAYGLPTWLDKAIVHKGSVLYIAAEGSSGFKNRIAAWQRKREIVGDDARFRLIKKSMSFMDRSDIERLDRTVAEIVERFGQVDTVFVDTVSRVLPGADENLQKDMTVFVAACDLIREKYGATVVGVHHTNKNGDMRGSTVFLGQGDFVLRVDKNETHTGGVVTCEKQKDAEDGWKRLFVVERMEWASPGKIKPSASLVVNFDVRTNDDEPTWPARELCKDMQRLIEDAWIKGRPWSPHRRAMSEGKYAVRNLSEALQMKASTVEMVIDKWLSNEVVIFETADQHTKAKGLKVAKWID